ncbi:16S rRNA (guanine(527)-N(7))-methyltransferase RsmG [Terriglobus albidus]|uniref:Ribosomal RNA small subunit methyltransferase G n=1 Tax=Terriglobus albidus TaxID=1592106 RepID=A0A5B9E4S3_9BACT|nr:16S rRNA (guanine(527)-N(7))-methyltransferase RsmG [Terriglobus albidus]QEE26988.1 16S rRNA (guanine(527)-N(7))-methyltransferase RsmG [Terriglobus albidus]
MTTLSLETMESLLQPYLPSGVPAGVAEKLSGYLDLLLKWNARTNLTAIRQPEEMVRRHFGESLFAGGLLPAETGTLLDLGSGGGFPGIPIQILRPETAVTLAESQGKKAAFLREVVRTLGLKTAVWGDRAEKLAESFDVVAMRAVDKMQEMIPVAEKLVGPGGYLMLLTTRVQVEELRRPARFVVPLPGSVDGVVALFHVEQAG